MSKMQRENSILAEGNKAFREGEDLLGCPYDPHTEERRTWMRGVNEAEREAMNPVMRWLTGEGVLSTGVGWIVFIAILVVVFNSWVFIAEFLGIPWSSTGRK